MSRLALEKGNLRAKLDEQSRVILESATARAESVEKIVALQQDRDKLVARNAEHQAEIVELGNTVTTMRKKSHAAEQDIVERFTAGSQLTAEKLVKVSAKSVAADNLANPLKNEVDKIKMEAEKGKEEKSRTEMKLSHMSREHAIIFSVRSRYPET